MICGGGRVFYILDEGLVGQLMARLGVYRRLHDLQFIDMEPPREDVPVRQI